MDARIASVTARQILDSRGRPTVEADVVTRDGSLGRASVPSGASTGQHEAHELRDGIPTAYDGASVLRAVRNVTDTLALGIRGMDARDQAAIDARMTALDGTPNKTRLGANALLAVSLATARAAAECLRLPVWRHLAGSQQPLLPMPMINAISGGAHASHNLDVQDFLIVPVGAETYTQALGMGASVLRALRKVLTARGITTLRADEGGFGPPLHSNRHALDLLVEAIEQAGYTPGEHVAIAIDFAATQFFDASSQTYRLEAESSTHHTDTLIDMIAAWIEAYPIVSIEDPLAEDDWDGWRDLTHQLGNNVQVIGDDLFTTKSQRVRHGIELGAANAVLVKMNQIGTLTETLDVVHMARGAGYRCVISARSGETEDPFVADLAVATAAGQIKVGSLTQSERLAKYNQLLRIEEALEPNPPFARW
jgi:enolase